MFIPYFNPFHTHSSLYNNTNSYIGSKSNADLQNLFLITIKSVLEDKGYNKKSQLIIENIICDYLTEVSSSKENIIRFFGGFEPSLLSNNKFKSFLFKKFEQLDTYISILKDNCKDNKIKFRRQEHKIFIPLIRAIFLQLSPDEIRSAILSSLLQSLTHYNSVEFVGDDNVNSWVHDETSYNFNIGERIVDVYIRLLRMQEDAENNTKTKLSEFKDYLATTEDYKYLVDHDGKLVELKFCIGSFLTEIMYSCGFITSQIVVLSKNEKKNVVKVSDEIFQFFGESIKNKAFDMNINLPMVTEPNDYIFDENNNIVQGGYLLNNDKFIQPLFTRNIDNSEEPRLNNNIIVSSINSMMKTTFKINVILLEFLENNPKYLLDEHHELMDKDKLNSRDKKILQSHISERVLQDFILKLANTYKNSPFLYFPLMLDFRGRIYNRATYLNFQGCELAKALLIFSKPCIIKRDDNIPINYIKAFVATSFGNGLDKKSIVKKINWVDDNMYKIINLDPSLIDLADNKYQFISSCFELKRLVDFLTNSNESEFRSYLPLKLDATCNGFQHLSMLSEEVHLFEHLNLSEVTISDDPRDFYSYILDKVKAYLIYKALDTKSEEIKKTIIRLTNLNLNRKHIKQLIMTKPYNATDHTLVNYVLENLVFRGYGTYTEKFDINPIGYDYDYKFTDNLSDYDSITSNKNGEKIVSLYSTDTTSNNFITRYDIRFFVETFNFVLYDSFPQIKLLTQYLRNIAAIFNKYELPITWRLPSGLVVSQRYIETKVKRIKPYSFSDKTLSLSIKDKSKIDKRKQINAFMPNLVHSLDSTSLVLVYLNLQKDDNTNINFFSVHDCFGVSATDVDKLINVLRNVYIGLYSDSKYIQTLDDDIIQTLIKALSNKSNQVVYDKDKRTITFNDKIIKLPPLPINYKVPIKEKLKIFNRIKKSISIW